MQLKVLFISADSNKLLHIKFNCLKVDIFIITCLISTQPHLNVITSWRGKLFHEPRRVVEGTSGVQLTTALTIPERIIGIESVLELTFTGGVAEVIIPHIGWDGDGGRVIDVGAGTESVTMDGGNLMNSSCKSPDVFPGIVSMCKANTIHIVAINCGTTI